MRTATTGFYPLIPMTGQNTIILDDLDFGFENWELLKIKTLWEEGERFEDIAQRMVRRPEEILLALIHLAREGELTRPFARRLP